MKVEGPGSTKSAGAVRKTGKAARADGASFASSLNETAGDARSEDVSATASAGVSQVDALLALQEVEASGDALGGGRNRTAYDWGEEMLDALDGVRTGLLLGIIPSDRLAELARSAAERKVVADDPRLAEILEEIELRARVELAKLGR